MHRPLTSLISLALLGASLSACSGGTAEPEPSPSASVSSTQSPTTVPELEIPAGVTLTENGSELEVGDTATVAYEVRQDVVGVLDIKVTRLEKTSFKESFQGWDLSASDKEAAPYFVRATVTNVGDSDLGGQAVPLYIVDGDNALVQANSFGSTFEPCNPGAFPESFPSGESVKVCLVYLSPNDGDLVAVSFRPIQEVNPITWTGELQKVKSDEPKKGKGKGKKDAAAAN